MKAEGSRFKLRNGRLDVGSYIKLTKKGWTLCRWEAVSRKRASPIYWPTGLMGLQALPSQTPLGAKQSMGAGGREMP